MEIKPATTLPPARQTVDAYLDLINRLRELGSVKAEVLRSAPGWMVLRTPLGKLLTANSLPLREGEQLRLRIEDRDGQPLLKLAPITRRPLAPLALQAAAYPRLVNAAKNAGGSPLLGVVERATARAVSARFPSGTETLPPIPGAGRGDWLLLHARPSADRIEIFPVEREAVNRALLRRLLPNLQGAPGNNLPRLAQLLLRAIDVLIKHPPQASAPAMDSVGKGQADRSASITPSKPVLPVRTAILGAAANIANGSNVIGTGANRAPASLQPLLDHLPRLDDINSRSIRKWFEFLQLARPLTVPGKPGAVNNLPAVLHRLSNPEHLGRELNGAVQASKASTDDPDLPGLREMIMQLARDVARLAEQGLAQNLGGRASSGLQQEAQQPFAISLTIPLLERDDIQPLRVDLSQRGQGEPKAATCWDIRLDFEFDGLGAIACHGVLSEQEVTASFYSALASTRDQIDAALPDLTRQLGLAGFTTGEFHSFVGTPPSVNAAAAHTPSGLIDLQA